MLSRLTAPFEPGHAATLIRHVRQATQPHRPRSRRTPGLRRTSVSGTLSAASQPAEMSRPGGGTACGAVAGLALTVIKGLWQVPSMTAGRQAWVLHLHA